MNVVTLQGRLSRPAEERSLPSGDRLVQLELTVARTGEKADSVPVVCPDAPASVAGLAAGDEIVVLGRVRRRFFRAGGSTQSRTEVVADHIVRASHTKKVAALFDRAHERLDELQVTDA